MDTKYAFGGVNVDGDGELAGLWFDHDRVWSEDGRTYLNTSREEMRYLVGQMEDALGEGVYTKAYTDMVLEAAQAVVNNWESGDLAEAVRRLAQIVSS